jgi:hypothetical protein
MRDISQMRYLLQKSQALLADRSVVCHVAADGKFLKSKSNKIPPTQIKQSHFSQEQLRQNDLYQHHPRSSYVTCHLYQSPETSRRQTLGPQYVFDDLRGTIRYDVIVPWAGPDNMNLHRLALFRK